MFIVQSSTLFISFPVEWIDEILDGSAHLWLINLLPLFLWTWLGYSNAKFIINCCVLYVLQYILYASTV